MRSKDISFFYALCLLGLGFETTWGSTGPSAIVVIDPRRIDANSNVQAIFDKFHEHEAINHTQLSFTTVVSSSTAEVLEKVCSLVGSGAVVLLDMSSSAQSALLRTRAKGITYIAAYDKSYLSSLQPSELPLMVQPTAIQMLEVVPAIARAEGLNNIALVFDETFDIPNTPRRILTNVPAQHLYVHMANESTVNEQHIKTIVDFDIKYIFIIANKSNAQKFLALLSDRMLREQNFDPDIFILTKDGKVICGTCEPTQKVDIVKIIAGKLSPDEFVRYMKQITGRDFDSEMIKVDEAMAFDLARLMSLAVENVNITDGQGQCINPDLGIDPYRGLNDSLIDELTRISINGTLGPLSWDAEYQSITYNMELKLSMVSFHQRYKEVGPVVATYSRDTGLQKEKTLLKETKKMKYRIVTVAPIPPFVYKEKNGTGDPVYRGYCIDLLDKIAADLNFDYSIFDREIVGSMDEDGNWTGVIQDLMEDNADIAVGPISVMAERENVIDFTVPYYDLVGLTILMRKAKFDYSLVKFLSVLDEEVWGCIIGAFFLFSILISVFDRLSPFSYQNRRAHWKGSGAEPRVFTLKEGVWFCMMSLTPQGGGETPKALSGRLVAATWWLFGFIIIATYTANLAAFLTVSRLETPIESLDDLSNQFKVQYAPMNGSVAMIYFQRMAHIEHKFYEIWKDMSLDDNKPPAERAKLAVWDYPVSDKYTKLWETMQKSGFPQSKPEAVDRVLTEEFAFISDATTNKYQTLINCDLWEVGEEFSRKPYALAVQQGSSLRTKLSDAILKLINQRVLEELKSKWWKEDEKECPKLEDESDGISIRNIGGVFLVIAVGSGLSLITLAFECYWYRFRADSKSRRSQKSNNTNKGKLNSSSTQSTIMGADNSNSNGKQEGHQSLDANFVSMQFTDINPGGIGSEFTADRILDRVYTNWF